MQIVIDIPEGMLDELRTCKFPIQDAYRLCAIIENGTPLPKGHGRLKDADAIVARFKEHKKFYVDSYGGFFQLMTITDKARCDEIDSCWADVINEPTIIEADKEVDDADSN